MRTDFEGAVPELGAGVDLDLGPVDARPQDARPGDAGEPRQTVIALDNATEATHEYFHQSHFDHWERWIRGEGDLGRVRNALIYQRDSQTSLARRYGVALTTGRTIEDVGIPGIVLMERAALGAVDALLAHFQDHADMPARIGILCGAGNNGGDGFAMARLFHELGVATFVGTIVSPTSYRGDARANLDVLENLRIDVRDLSSFGTHDLGAALELVEPADVWVDALLGTGLDRDVEGLYRAAVEFLNTQPRVLAVDIPSGVHADTGQVMGVAVHASATASFGHVKIGQSIYPGREHCGALYPVDIGIPARVSRDVGWTAELLVDDRWVPPRAPTTHKGEAGRIACIGGAPQTLGAVLMTARGALHSGAGLITVGTYDACVGRVAPTTHELMARPVLARTLEQCHVDELDELLEWADIVAVGPGMGTHEGALEVLELVLESDCVVVADADALTLLADHHMQLQPLGLETVVLTPHPGEASRLCACSTAEVLADPVGRALEISAEWSDAIVVLKGASTVVARNEPRRIAINSTGNAGMATGGTGDLLTGMIAYVMGDGVTLVSSADETAKDASFPTHMGLVD